MFEDQLFTWAEKEPGSEWGMSPVSTVYHHVVLKVEIGEFKVGTVFDIAVVDPQDWTLELILQNDDPGADEDPEQNFIFNLKFQATPAEADDRTRYP